MTLDHKPLVLGVDIGGTHITAALTDLKARQVVPESWTRLAVNTHGTKEEIAEAWVRTIEGATKAYPAWSGKTGIAMPGPCDYENGISLIRDQDKLDALYQVNIKELLAGLLPVKVQHIKMMNDAGCFLKGEVYGGAAMGFNHAIGLTLGTGVGTARYHDGLAADADLWHVAFRDSMPEEYFTSRWFRRRYRELTGEQVPGAKEIAAVAETNPVARQVFEEYGKTLGEFLEYFTSLDKPEVIVLGGNITHALALFYPALEQELKKRNINIPVRKATLGENAALIGAASSWEESTGDGR